MERRQASRPEWETIELVALANVTGGTVSVGEAAAEEYRHLSARSNFEPNIRGVTKGDVRSYTSPEGRVCTMTRPEVVGLGPVYECFDKE
jgi:hypothetical protein